MHVGAQVTPGGVRFRVWAPERRNVRVVLDGTDYPLARETDGYFAATLTTARAGMHYHYRLDDDLHPYPDPATRFQPHGPHGPSQIIDADAYRWRHARLGATRQGQVIYEVHIGTFTEQGTFLAAIERLAALARLGVTVIEVMPVGEFAGRFNWGYDGVCLFAPSHVYGGPHDFRTFVDAAHAQGLAVILDVVYNHFGPDGNYHPSFSPHYHASQKTEWGDAINFDGEQSQPVRDFITANAAYWIREFRLDGLRLDATQSIHDRSNVHILAEITAAARAASREPLLIVAENEPQDTRLLWSTDAGGHGIDALWNDDFHHAARVALTQHNEAYMSGYRGEPQEFISLVRCGFLYQGQYFQWQGKPRGTPSLEQPAYAFVAYLENHDQVANTGLGRRLCSLCAPAELRALTASLLLGPATPMLFQGQEFGSQAPFVFFADHTGTLASATRRGRLEFLSQFPTLTDAEAKAAIPDPSAEATFARCKLRAVDDTDNNPHLALHADLIRLRKTDAAFAVQRADCIHGAVVAPRAFALRFRVPETEERLLVVNLGLDLSLPNTAEPLLAPPRGTRWTTLWSSEAVRYGGGGVRPSMRDGVLAFQGRCAVVLGAR